MKAHICDGCGEVIVQPTVSGEPGFIPTYPDVSVPLPRRAFEWCANCALIAFDAVRRATGDGELGRMRARYAYERAMIIYPDVAREPMTTWIGRWS